MKIILFILGSAVSYLLIRYRVAVKDFLGDVALAEKYLGSGGTHTFIILFAIFIFVLSLMYLLGTLEAVLESLFGEVLFV